MTAVTGPDGRPLATADANNDGQITQDEYLATFGEEGFDDYDLNSDGVIKRTEYERPSSTLAGSQCLDAIQWGAIYAASECGAVMDYFMEALQKSANSEEPDGTDALTPEQYEEMIDELELWYEQYANNSNGEMGKDDFRKFLKRFSDENGLGWDDDVIENYTDKLYPNAALWGVTHSFEEVKAFMIEKNMIPAAPTVAANPPESPESAYIVGDLTPEKYDELMSQLERWYQDYANNNNEQMGKDDFRKFLRKFSDTYNLGWDDDVIENYTDTLYPNAGLWGVTHSFEEVKAFMIEKNMIPGSRPEASGTGDPENPGAEPFVEDPEHGALYNKYKRMIDAQTDFSSASMGLWANNLISKIQAYAASVVALVNGLADLIKGVQSSTRD